MEKLFCVGIKRPTFKTTPVLPMTSSDTHDDEELLRDHPDDPVVCPESAEAMDDARLSSIFLPYFPTSLDDTGIDTLLSNNQYDQNNGEEPTQSREISKTRNQTFTDEDWQEQQHEDSVPNAQDSCMMIDSDDDAIPGSSPDPVDPALSNSHHPQTSAGTIPSGCCISLDTDSDEDMNIDMEADANITNMDASPSYECAYHHVLPDFNTTIYPLPRRLSSDTLNMDSDSGSQKNLDHVLDLDSDGPSPLCSVYGQDQVLDLQDDDDIHVQAADVSHVPPLSLSTPSACLVFYSDEPNVSCSVYGQDQVLNLQDDDIHVQLADVAGFPPLSPTTPTSTSLASSAIKVSKCFNFSLESDLDCDQPMPQELEWRDFQSSEILESDVDSEHVDNALEAVFVSIVANDDHSEDMEQKGHSRKDSTCLPPECTSQSCSASSIHPAIFSSLSKPGFCSPASSLKTPFSLGSSHGSQESTTTFSNSPNCTFSPIWLEQDELQNAYKHTSSRSSDECFRLNAAGDLNYACIDSKSGDLLPFQADFKTVDDDATSLFQQIVQGEIHDRGPRLEFEFEYEDHEDHYNCSSDRDGQRNPFVSSTSRTQDVPSNELLHYIEDQAFEESEPGLGIRMYAGGVAGLNDDVLDF
ncbi:hypothetical protein EV361DRAFT_173149 [Lentinula raphanica]|nr:hypothetical protein EV361DRAFT_173149 [Lentinula raphanica]